MNNYKGVPEYQGTSSVFWKFIQENNPSYTKFKNDDSGIALRSKAKISSFLYYEKEYGTNPTDSAECFMVNKIDGDSLYTNRIKRIVILEDNEPNACVTPNGLVMVNSALFDMLTPREFVSVVAHEVAHFKLQHACVNYLKWRKREKRNKIFAGIGTAVFGGAEVYANSLRRNPSSQYLENTYRVGEALEQYAEYNAMMFMHKYSREQEIEADIVAAKYLEWCEIGPEHLITALEKLAEYMVRHGISVSETNSYSDHPSLKLRIDILKRIYIK